jgi:hypothetical protein
MENFEIIPTSIFIDNARPFLGMSDFELSKMCKSAQDSINTISRGPNAEKISSKLIVISNHNMIMEILDEVACRN